MATNDELRGIKPFDCRGDSTSVGPRWRRWRKSFQFYVDGRGITAGARRKAYLKGKMTMFTRLHFEHSKHTLHHK